MTKRVALIGYGLAGRVFHAPLIDATDDLDLAYVVTSSPERAAHVRDRYPNAEVVADVDGLWERSDGIDLVTVASPNASHVSLATAALNNGIGVVVDKPLAASSAQGAGVVALAQEKGLFCSVFQNRRWDGDFLTVQGLVEDGTLGRIHRFESRYERWRPQVDTSRWRESAQPDMAGGLLYDLGSHLADQALHLFGPVQTVYAEVQARRDGAQVDDDVFVALQHRSGTHSHLWTSVLAAQLGPRFRVLGDGAAYVCFGLDPQEDQLKAGLLPHDPGFGEVPQHEWGTVASNGDVEAIPTTPGRYLEYYLEVARALHGKGPGPVDPADSVAALQVLEAARESARTGTVVDLDQAAGAG